MRGKNGTFDEGLVAKVEYLSTMSQMQGDRYAPLAPKTLGETPFLAHPSVPMPRMRIPILGSTPRGPRGNC
jgi:hypothetical protein